MKYKEVIFHFNKKSLEDPTVPMWVLKMKGQTHYVDHVIANAPWNTKETPDNPHTKGSLKFKHVDVEIENGTATIRSENA